MTPAETTALMGAHTLVMTYACTTTGAAADGAATAALGDRTCGGAGGRQRMFTWDNSFFLVRNLTNQIARWVGKPPKAPSSMKQRHPCHSNGTPAPSPSWCENVVCWESSLHPKRKLQSKRPRELDRHYRRVSTGKRSRDGLLCDSSSTDCPPGAAPLYTSLNCRMYLTFKKTVLTNAEYLELRVPR